MPVYLNSTAQLTLNASADATRLIDFRKRLKNSPDEMDLKMVTINDIMLFVISRVLPRFKYMNSHFLGDKILEFDAVNLAFAVDTPDGLMAPVIHNSHRLSLREIEREADQLNRACVSRKIPPEKLSGATFTVSNLGVLGIESFTPILSPPQTAILGICSIEPKPVQNQSEISLVPSMGLSLTIDHRAIDGLPAAQFLKSLSESIANIDLLIAS